ncbi:MAG: DUF4956 domain-containing protein [Clostridiales bacterium]|nr:DUF4956 domain-containing protein [Clostridiales bacterium]
MISNGLFTSLLLNEGYVVPRVGMILICIGAALVLGLITSFLYMYKNTYNKGFAAALVLLPMVVAAVVSVVNGNIGIGIAVGGAFGLVRFRSAPGTARDILAIFLAMAAGLICGSGYVALALIVVILVCLIGFILLSIGFGGKSFKSRMLRITVPESLDYTGAFNDIFKKYTTSCELEKVKTTNMGSLYKLFYKIDLKDPRREKEMIDAIRVRNGNLEIVCGIVDTSKPEL